jgi:hypothetical protein
MRAIVSINPKDRVLIIDNKSAGKLPQPFEQDYKFVVVLDTKGLEIRQYEQLEMGRTKYAIHRERMVADFEVPEVSQATENKFISSFMRVWVKDKLDVRKAAKFALKSLKPSF